MWNSPSKGNSAAAPSVLRQLVESGVLLALAVVLFRSFAAEGYLISTGSMAPCLLGYHKQVVCPSCQYHFAHGDTTGITGGQDYAYAGQNDSGFVGWADEPLRQVTTCPNCGRQDIDLSHVPQNEGDQLLVHKHAFDFRDPRRWEVIVFRSSDNPQQAYCKRVVGLPGEELSVVDGDIYVAGELQRKSYEVQKSIRIPVWDNDFQPGLEDAPPRWMRTEENSGWQPAGSGFRFEPASKNAGELRYYHWLRGGGTHWTSVPLANWPGDMLDAERVQRDLLYREGEGRLYFQGVMADDDIRRLVAESSDSSWRAAIEEFAAESHFGPIHDEYGYNEDGSRQGNLVHDLMLEIQLIPVDHQGRFEIQLDDGADGFQFVLDFDENTFELLANGDPVPVRSGPLPPTIREKSFRVEMSTFDRQLLVAVGGELVFEPLTYTKSKQPRQPLRSPVALRASGGSFGVDHLELYRDVYYTEKGDGEHGPGATLSPDEFYVLGDNSPISADSRVWKQPAVNRSQLIGKPLVVHLPSKQGEVSFGGRTSYLRIPDFHRVRYIR
ncbi:MAG: signal peptidase I [Planctomycetaceae bacterium]|nr:signal peptidase I [Planctomycetaceae bacterium]